MFDPFLALTVAAVATTRLKLGTSVLLIGERNPLLTAREAASLDQISAGRFLLGVGVGWSRRSTWRWVCRGSAAATAATSTSRP